MLFKKKVDFVIQNKNGKYYGCKNNKHNIWVDIVDYAYTYTKKEAVIMCSYFGGVILKKEE